MSGVYLLGRVDGPQPDWVSIGASVRVCFAALGDSDVVLPQLGGDPAGTVDVLGMQVGRGAPGAENLGRMVDVPAITTALQAQAPSPGA